MSGRTCGGTQIIRFGVRRGGHLGNKAAEQIRRLRERVHHGPQSHRVIALAATGQLGMAAAGQIRLAVVTGALTADQGEEHGSAVCPQLCLDAACPGPCADVLSR
jgi:hypothetical protein